MNECWGRVCHEFVDLSSLICPPFFLHLCVLLASSKNGFMNYAEYNSFYKHFLQLLILHSETMASNVQCHVVYNILCVVVYSILCNKMTFVL